MQKNSHTTNGSVRDFAPPLATQGEVFAKRTDMSLTQKELAAEMGVTEFSVWRWESGSRAITETHTRILRALHAHFVRTGHL